MKTDTTHFVSRSAFQFFSGTLLSRVTGMLRDIAMAFCFGTSPELAAFLLSYRFVYLIRRLFGEGLLHQGFIPHFEITRAEDQKRGALFFRDLFWTFALVLGAGSLLAEMGLSFFASEIPKLAMLMLPGIFFLALCGLTCGVSA